MHKLIPTLSFWRDSNGNEIDLVIEQGAKLMPVEIKSGRTLMRDSFAGLEKWCVLAGDAAERPSLIYGGDDAYQQKGIRVIGWRKSGELL